MTDGGIRIPLFCNAKMNCAAMALAKGTGYAVSTDVANLFVASVKAPTLMLVSVRYSAAHAVDR